MATVFSGFSTVGGNQVDNYKLYDLALIRQDLLNHFYTRPGERVMRPTYGCAIWDYLMEPFTDSVRLACIQEAQRICQADSRVTVVDMNATSLEHTIRIELILNYLPFDAVDQFTLNFEAQQTSEGF